MTHKVAETTARPAIPNHITLCYRHSARGSCQDAILITDLKFSMGQPNFQSYQLGCHQYTVTHTLTGLSQPHGPIRNARPRTAWHSKWETLWEAVEKQISITFFFVLIALPAAHAISHHTHTHLGSTKSWIKFLLLRGPRRWTGAVGGQMAAGMLFFLISLAHPPERSFWQRLGGRLFPPCGQRLRSVRRCTFLSFPCHPIIHTTSFSRSSVGRSKKPLFIYRYPAPARIV